MLIYVLLPPLIELLLERDGFSSTDIMLCGAATFGLLVLIISAGFHPTHKYHRSDVYSEGDPRQHPILVDQNESTRDYIAISNP